VSETTELDILESPTKMLEVIRRAQEGDQNAVPSLRKMLDRVPELRNLMGGDLEQLIEHTISRSMGVTDDLAFQEAVKRKLEDLRAELEGPAATPTERLLVDRVVACWLQVQEADFRYAQTQSCSIEEANYHLKRQDRAHRRFLSAMKTLAQVRKLAVPALQVNIGQNQVNVANVDNSDSIV
jgi:hypothetical protein